MYQQPTHTRVGPPGWMLAALPPGTAYLGESETHWYFMAPGQNPALAGFFDNVGNMFKRMVKFTPKSFTPGNIFKGVANTTLGVASGGLFYALPKNVKNTITKAASVAIPVVGGAVLAYTAGPAVMSVLGPKLSAAGSLLGKAASTLGGNLFSFLNKLPQSQQAAVAEQVTPQDIVAMEQSQQVPAHLLPLLQQAAQVAYPDPQQTSGAASLYADPFGMNQPPSPPAQASMFGELSPVALALLIGGPILVAVLQRK